MFKNLTQNYSDACDLPTLPGLIRALLVGNCMCVKYLAFAGGCNVLELGVVFVVTYCNYPFCVKFTPAHIGV